MLNSSFSFPEFTATQKRKEDVRLDRLCNSGEGGEVRNAMLPSRPITVLAVRVAATCSYGFLSGLKLHRRFDAKA